MTTTLPLSKIIEEFIAERDVSEISKRQYTRVINLFYRYMQSNNIAYNEVTIRDVVAYKTFLNKRNLYTSNGYLSIIKVFYKWLASKGYSTDITGTIKKNKGFYGFTKKILTIDQVRSLYAAIPADTSKGLRDSAIIRLMLSTGIRTIEVVRSNIGDIERMQDSYILRLQRKGKLEKNDFVALTDHVYDIISKYLNTRTNKESDAPLFANVREGSKETRLTTRCVSGMVSQHMKASGIDDKKITTHSLRHTFATWLIKDGADIYDVMTAMGHSTVKTTEIYLKMVKQDLKLSNKTGKAIESILERNGIT